MKVRFNPRSLEEVDRVGLQYALASVQTSEAFLARLEQAADRLRTSAPTFPLIPGRRRGREIRFVSLDKFPYALIYEVLEDEVAILGLWHEKSRSEDWSRRKA